MKKTDIVFICLKKKKKNLVGNHDSVKCIIIY